MPKLYGGIESQIQPFHANIWCWTASDRIEKLNPDGRRMVAEYNNTIMEDGDSLSVRDGILSIEKGTRITSQNGLWTHVVGEKDKSIRLIDRQKSTHANFVVVDKQPKFTVRITGIGPKSEEFPRIERCAENIQRTVPWGESSTISYPADVKYLVCDKTWDLIVPDSWACYGFSFNTNSYGRYNIQVRSHCHPISRVSSNEQIALECLREMITESDFRKYMRTGFLLIRGQSGLVYQIRRHSDHIRVWNRGKIVEEICIGIRDRNIPPTDRIVAMKVMIESDEDEIRHCGNVYRVGPPRNMNEAA